MKLTEIGMTTEELIQAHLLKDYTHWSLSLHSTQSYLGRAVVWAHRPDALELADATDEELAELRDILARYREVVRKLFQADWMNFAFLGNLDRHMHGHIIPRYSGPRVFGEKEFTDPEWGKHYDPTRLDPIAHETKDGGPLFDALRTAIRAELEQ
jgi:diadenosine tetraphosphate (Ap4A) HIT family hydrolase